MLTCLVMSQSLSRVSGPYLLWTVTEFVNTQAVLLLTDLGPRGRKCWNCS